MQLKHIFVHFLVAFAGIQVSNAVGEGFGCKGKPLCVTFPNNCNSAADCDLGVHLEKVNKDDSTINVHVIGRTTSREAYVALGFSKDSLMGEDAVIACFTEGRVQTFVNPGHPGDHTPSQSKAWASGSPSSTGNSFNGLQMDCKFTLPTNIDAGQGITFDLMTSSPNVFVVTGLGSISGLQHHQPNKVTGTLPPSVFGPLPSPKSPSETTTQGPPVGPRSGSGSTNGTIRPPTPSMGTTAFGMGTKLLILISSFVVAGLAGLQLQ